MDTYMIRGGLAIGSTGRIPGGLAANLARCPTFILLLLLFFNIVVIVAVAVNYCKLNKMT